MIHPVGAYGDIDNGPSKSLLMSDTVKYHSFYVWAFGKRPAEELYDLKSDPNQLINLVKDPRYKSEKARLKKLLRQWQKQTKDPRLRKQGDVFETYPYYG